MFEYYEHVDIFILNISLSIAGFIAFGIIANMPYGSLAMLPTLSMMISLIATLSVIFVARLILNELMLWT